MAVPLQVAFDTASYVDTSTLTHVYKHVHTMAITVFAKIITNDSPNTILISFDGSTLHDCILPNSTHYISLAFSGFGSYFFSKGTKIYLKIPTGLAIQTGQMCIAGYGLPN